MAAMKMRYLYFSKAKKMEALGEAVKAEYELENINALDVIPPAYACDRERIVFIAATIKKEPDDVLRRFCAELNKGKAGNVALVIDGVPQSTAVTRLIEALEEAGTNVVGEPFYTKCGLFAKLEDAEKAEFLKWTHTVVENLK